jgi:sugar lactone lactonase YvrE
VLAVHVATDGRIWVQRWMPEGKDGSAYDVFTRDGTYLSTVLFPARFGRAPSPVFTSNRVYGVVLDEETEVQQVGAFEVSIP